MIRFKNGRLMVKIDHRFPAGKNPDLRLKYLKGILNQAVRKSGWKRHLEMERNNPAFFQPARSRLVDAIQASLQTIGKRGKPLTRPGCTEAGYLAKIADQVLTIGPGVSYGNAHQPNERVKVAELEEAVEFYRELIKRLCFY
ncbi:MAG: M20/M25/M40 family metallo-hydrolase [Deltaproteobacteria bacterium]|nr:M20/M25/M40 family metallo-hydrolase [Deltaproteobacteria bacterium]